MDGNTALVQNELKVWYRDFSIDIDVATDVASGSVITYLETEPLKPMKSRVTKYIFVTGGVSSSVVKALSQHLRVLCSKREG